MGIAAPEPVSGRGTRHGWTVALVASSVLVITTGGVAIGADGATDSARNVVIELYVHGDRPEDVAIAKRVQEAIGDRPGILFVLRDVSASEKHQARLQTLTDHFQLKPETTPLVYGTGQVVTDRRSADEYLDEIRRLLTMQVFVRSGCPRCAEAKRYLVGFQTKYPALRIEYRDLVYDASAVNEMNRLVARHRTAAASVPVFHVCDRLVVGFASPSLTGQRLDALLERWTLPCPAQESAPKPASGSHQTYRMQLPNPIANRLIAAVVQQVDEEPPPLELDDLPELSLPTDSADPDDLPLTDDRSTEPTVRTIDLPVFGTLDVNQVGLVSLTLAIGLVDGFNPCAMWVLLFLLSLLVNLRDRRKILAIAGTFILVSGLAYFAFMAAWLNVFLFIGYLRPIQIALGVIAIAVGTIHIKDFFAFHKGISLSIPEAAKPAIYSRVRKVITAENLAGAMFAVITLAVMVNIVELLCTAGLPALYTEILSTRDLALWQNYAYLGLYNVAYMFDDMLMVAAVVVTLEKCKLQETQGRWLKLISGIVIVVLGVIMLLRPEWLV